MVIIVNKEEKLIVEALRAQQLANRDSAPALTAEVLSLKRAIADLEINKSRLEEDHAKQERELRHMIGLEKRRQEVELEQAKRDASLTARETQIVQERARFEETLKFNTSRFEAMEKYQKETLTEVLNRLPNINVKMGGSLKR
jgi:hypothetical protein